MNDLKFLKKQAPKQIPSVPLTVKSLEDLRYYGCLRAEIFNKNIPAKETEFYELKCIQDSEASKYKEDPWNYYINFYNFRDKWDFESSKKRIGFFGCSFTTGEGIKSEDTFVQIVGKQLGLNPFNFGTGGASIERIARIFSAATRLIDLDIAVITFPSWYRHLHVDNDGRLINLLPDWHRLNDGYDKLSKSLSSFEDNFHLLKATANINWIYDIACYKNIKILFTSWDHPLNSFCKLILPKNTLEPFPNIDDKCARDNMHPGIKSQRAHANQIIEALHDRTWF
jgi:hypothetical protein